MKIPRHWAIETLEECVAEFIDYRGKSPNKSSSGIPLITAKTVRDGFLDFSEPEFIPANEYDEWMSRGIPLPGDILFTTEAPLGNVAEFPANGKFALAQRVITLRGKPGVLDNRYLMQYLLSSLGRRQIELRGTGSTAKGIKQSELRKVSIPRPPVKEQEQVAEILNTWGFASQTLDKLIAAKERHKQGLMQQLLHAAAEKTGHGHTRHRVGNVVERVTRKNTIGNDNVLTISAQDGLINQREYFNRSVAGADLSGYFLLQRGEFAYNRSSSIGYPYGAIKRLDRYDQGIVSTLYLCFRVHDTAQISSDYLAHYLDGGYLNSGLRAIAKEGARAHGLLNVTAEEFMDLDIFFPPLPLQQKIAAILEAAEEELRLLREQRTALDEQKRGLMQQLLTGKRRVTL